MTVLFDHVSRTLPDSLSQRRVILNALDCLMLEAHPCKTNVRDLLNGVIAQQALEAELQSKFHELTSRKN